MRIDFRPLFTLAVAHAYYRSRCRDFRFLVSAEAARRLAGGRMLARERDGVLHVLYEADDDGAPRARLPGAVLHVGLGLLNPHLGNVTALPADFPERALRFANVSEPGALEAAPGVRLTGPRFTHEPERADRPVTVRLRDPAGAAVATELLADGAGAAAFDLGGRAEGGFTVEESYAAGAGRTTPLFLSDELLRRGAVGVVEVRIDEGFYAAPPALEIALAPREEVLRYYVVARNFGAADVDRLAVADAGAEVDGRAPIDFERVLPAGFEADEIPAARLAGPDERVVLFRSRVALARRERGRRRIQLSREDDVLIANLPQPAADAASAELIIHVAKP
jgi:hypothetical protein